ACCGAIPSRSVGSTLWLSQEVPVCRFTATAKPSFAVIEKVNLAEFQNPQQEPGMERRLLLVFALTFLVIVLFQPLLKKYYPQPTAPPTPTQAQVPLPASPAANPVTIAPTKAAASAANVTKQAST